MRPLDQLAEIAQKAVRIGNDLIKTSRPQTVTEKTDRDTYTDVDVRIEQEIRAYLSEATPEIGFIGEEEGHSRRPADGQQIWALDPIDGTANFVHGVPISGISLALQREDLTVVAAVSLPYWDLHYTAAAGNGAYANGKRIRTSTTTTLSKSMIAMGDFAVGEKAKEKNDLRITVTAALAAEAERVRLFGSAAHDLTWLAEGRIDGSVIFSNKMLDVAAGVLIAREAGARVVDSDGAEHTPNSHHTIAATPGIADALLDLIQRAKV